MSYIFLRPIYPALTAISLTLVSLINLALGQSLDMQGWERHQEGVSLKVELFTKQEGTVQKQLVRMSIKNMTDHTIYLDTAGGEILVYYINKAGQAAPLYDYEHEVFLNRPFDIDAGQTMVRVWDLPPDKLSLLRTYPFYITFTFWDPAIKKRATIRSQLITLKQHE